MRKGFETQAIRSQIDRSNNIEHSAPLYLTSSFVFPDAETMGATFTGETEGIIYSRYSNPNTDEFIQKVCAMEGCEDGFATGSGMSAVFASIAAFVEQGDHLIVSRACFGSTLLSRSGKERNERRLTAKSKAQLRLTQVSKQKRPRAAAK